MRKEMEKKAVPLWKYSCIDGLDFDSITSDIESMSEFEWKYENHSRKEDFQIFFVDISARAEQLQELMHNYRYYLAERDDCRGWNDFCVVMFGGTRRVLGYDVEEMDYYSLFGRGFGESGEDLAIEEAGKRLERLSKKELIERWQKVLTVLTAYFELKASYDSLTGALDFLENEGMTKSEELTQGIEDAYRRLEFYKGEAKENADYNRFDKTAAKIPHEVWVY